MGQQVVFTQWLNQTYNVLNNYVNRAGAQVDWSGLLTSYGLAVTASCSIALGAGKLMKAVPSLQVMGPFVPYLAVISAGSANLSFTRMDEWRGKGVFRLRWRWQRFGDVTEGGPDCCLADRLVAILFLANCTDGDACFGDEGLEAISHDKATS